MALRFIIIVDFTTNETCCAGRIDASLSGGVRLHDIGNMFLNGFRESSMI